MMPNERGPLRVAALTGGLNVPSARYRVRQFVAPLRSHGVLVREWIPRTSCYPPRSAILRPFWGGLALVERCPAVISSHRYDVTLLQRELISTFVTLEPFTKTPRVLDVDDAIHLRRGSKPARRLARMSDWVICGNDYLAEVFSRWNPNVTVMPTAVDTDRFVPAPGGGRAGEKSAGLAIGWIGTSANFKYLSMIESALARVLKGRSDAVLRIVSDRPPRFPSLPPQKVEFVRWSADSEVKSIQEMTIGIMPLADTEWERGKCSFKMLQYMACGVPAVVSPVGMNRLILSLGNVGVPASNENEWVSALQSLLDEPVARHDVGRRGRDVAAREFSVASAAPRLAELLKNVSSG